MNITAKELSGNHIGMQIVLGDSYATIVKIESGAQTVEIRAVSEPESPNPLEMYFLSIPATASITIQEGQ